mmetsp:Transcript_16422/g.20127  ORF Transcript_16422/g.20127 Transcript_16422/m.20127 type:complete len:206 (-) Transcript_16422:11-628(-)
MFRFLSMSAHRTVGRGSIQQRSLATCVLRKETEKQGPFALQRMNNLFYGFNTVQAKENLMQKQKAYLNTIRWELVREGRKRGHWSWYVFPNEDTARLEPYPKSALAAQHVPSYLAELPSDQLEDWRFVLEKICDLMDKRQVCLLSAPSFYTSAFFEVLPPQDRERVIKFIKLFKSAECEKPVWLLNVLNRLQHHIELSKLDPRAC